MKRARQAIDQLDNATTVFMGETVKRYNYLHEYSQALTDMLQAQKINSATYYLAIKILYHRATPSELAFDYDLVR